MLFNVLNKELLENKKNIVICPSRERVEKLKEMVESFNKKSSPQSALLIMLDSDDPRIEEYKELLGTKTAYHVGNRDTNTKLFNLAFQMFPNFEFYSMSNDDFVYLTACWDVKLMSDIKEIGKWGIAYGDDRVAGDKYPSHPIISGNIVRALGWLQLPSLKYLCGDWVWAVIGKGTGRLYYDQNVIIQHKHPFDKKTTPDAIFEKTNSQQMYAVDHDSYKRWLISQSRKDVAKIINAYFKEKDFNKTVSLCMIIGQDENLKNIKQCIDSVKEWIDELCVNINYKSIPNPIKIDSIKKLVNEYKTQFLSNSNRILSDTKIPKYWSDELSKDKVKISINKFNDFSTARNITLDQATQDYIIYLDCDDVVPNPWTIKDVICRYPDIDVFNCLVISSNVVHKEHIIQPRLLKRYDWLSFRNNVHEDISYSFKENNAKVIKTDIVVQHLGNKSRDKVSKKNIRNYKLTLKEINTDKAHSLTYFAIVNELMLFNKREKDIEAIQWIDKFFEKFPDDGKDPLIPKMWILRGACALNCNQVDAAKTNFAKAWQGWKHPEAAAMLGVCDMKLQNWDKAINVLEEVDAMETFKVCNVPIDMDSINLVIWENLGLSYYYKAQSIMSLRKNAPQMYNEDAHKIVNECFDKAEKNLLKYLSQEENNLTVADKLAEIFRERGKMSDANSISVSLVNMHPNYWQGFNNLGQFELMNHRYNTARLFFQEALRLNPNNKEIRHNLTMIENRLDKPIR